MEIIWEAVKSLPLKFRNKYNKIPWSDISGMRDKLMHQYFGVNLETVWKTIKEDIPELKEKILRIKKDKPELNSCSGACIHGLINSSIVYCRKYRKN